MDKRTQRLHALICSTKDRPGVYVLHGTDGDLLIDTGYSSCVHEVDEWIQKEHFKIRYIFFTHGHFDHCANGRFFKEKYGAKTILHEADRDLFYLLENQKLEPSSGQFQKYADYVNANWDKFEFSPVKIDYYLKDSDTDFLRKIGFDADVVMLPGHTNGSMGILQGKVLYTGDACSCRGGDYYTAMFGSSAENIRNSEKKIYDLHPLIIAPGHGKYVINERAFK